MEASHVPALADSLVMAVRVERVGATDYGGSEDWSNNEGIN